MYFSIIGFWYLKEAASASLIRLRTWYLVAIHLSSIRWYSRLVRSIRLSLLPQTTFDIRLFYRTSDNYFVSLFYTSGLLFFLHLIKIHSSKSINAKFVTITFNNVSFSFHLYIWGLNPALEHGVVINSRPLKISFLQ